VQAITTQVVPCRLAGSGKMAMEMDEGDSLRRFLITARW
jgi:hypothetical protein